MILIDFSQIAVGTCIEYNIRNPSQELDLNLMRHMLLSQIIGINKKFRKYNKCVVCFDSHHYWRKKVFPFYKSNRRADREKLEFDWGNFFTNLDQLKVEFKENIPFVFLEVEEAEADDLIAVISRAYSPYEKILIVSSDKDFLQLQKNTTQIEQWSLYKKKFLDASVYSLHEHVCRGDIGDGIPNCLSDDDAISNKLKRCKPIRATSISTMNVESEGYKRNNQLINFDFIPEDLSKTILLTFKEYDINNNFFKYCLSHRLKKILESGI